MQLEWFLSLLSLQKTTNIFLVAWEARFGLNCEQLPLVISYVS